MFALDKMTRDRAFPSGWRGSKMILDRCVVWPIEVDEVGECVEVLPFEVDSADYADRVIRGSVYRHESAIVYVECGLLGDGTWGCMSAWQVVAGERVEYMLIPAEVAAHCIRHSPAALLAYDGDCGPAVASILSPGYLKGFNLNV